MSKTTTHNDGRTDEEQHAWHGLPAMIGEAMVNPDYGIHSWGDYLVERDTRGDIVIYRVVDRAENEDELDETGDIVTPILDYYEAGEETGRIEAPEAEWSSEIEMIPESIWSGWD